MDWLDIHVGNIDKLRDKFPDDIYQATGREILVELSKDYDEHIQKKRNQYEKLTSFKERKEYYKILEDRERGYKGLKTAIENLKELPPYESWLTPNEFYYMKRVGYRNALATFIRTLIAI